MLTLDALVIIASLPGQQRHQQQRRYRKHHNAQMRGYGWVAADGIKGRQPAFIVVIQGSHLSGRN
jgi:hypothetical protein